MSGTIICLENSQRKSAPGYPRGGMEGSVIPTFSKYDSRDLSKMLENARKC